MEEDDDEEEEEDEEMGSDQEDEDEEVSRAALCLEIGVAFFFLTPISPCT